MCTWILKLLRATKITTVFFFWWVFTWPICSYMFLFNVARSIFLGVSLVSTTEVKCILFLLVSSRWIRNTCWQSFSHHKESDSYKKRLTWWGKHRYVRSPAKVLVMDPNFNSCGFSWIEAGIQVAPIRSPFFLVYRPLDADRENDLLSQGGRPDSNVLAIFPSHTRVGLILHFESYFYLFVFSRAVPGAYGGSQARGLIGAVAAGLRQSHSNEGSKLCLRSTP